MQVEPDHRARPAASAAARPSPRIAAALSLALPGLGQAYCGALWAAPIFAGLAVFFVLSMLQAWDQWRRSGFFLAVAALVLALYAANAAASSVLAARQARRMESHAAIWRLLGGWIEAGGARRSAAELFLLPGFAIASIGVLLHWPVAHRLGEALWYWPVFELLGGFSVGFYAGFVENLKERAGLRPDSTTGIAAGLIAFQAAAAALVYLVFRPPLLTVIAACALVLPGQMRTLVAVSDASRQRVILVAGSTLIALMLSFGLAFSLTSFLERPGVPDRDLTIFLSMTMGAFYALIRILLDTLIHEGKDMDAAP